MNFSYDWCQNLSITKPVNVNFIPIAKAIKIKHCDWSRRVLSFCFSWEIERWQSALYLCVSNSCEFSLLLWTTTPIRLLTLQALFPKSIVQKHILWISEHWISLLYFFQTSDKKKILLLCWRWFWIANRYFFLIICQEVSEWILDSRTSWIEVKTSWDSSWNNL